MPILFPVFDPDPQRRRPWDVAKDGPLGADPADPSGRPIIGFRRAVVFNRDAVEGQGLPDPAPPASPWDPLPQLEAVTAGSLAHQGPALMHGSAVACYEPRSDRVRMPPHQAFPDRTDYAITLLHELIHSTQVPSRLDRRTGARFRRKVDAERSQALEELVAELDAAMAAARLGLEAQPRDDHARYIAGWLGVLADQQQHRAFAWAVGEAARAAEYLVRQSEVSLAA